MKTCSKCGVAKERSEFYQRSGRPDGQVKSHCKACNKAAATAWLREHPEVNCARARKYRAEHPEKVRQAKLEWARLDRERNPEKWAARATRYAPSNRAKARLRYQADIENSRARASAEAAKCVAQLRDSYVCRAMRTHVAETPAHVIEAKRKHLRLVRLIKEKK